jgi:hypothetical protein
MGTAVSLAFVDAQVATGHIEHGFDVQVAVAFPHVAKLDVLRMPEEPCGLVVKRRSTFIERADPQRDLQLPTLPAQLTARRRGGATPALACAIL